MEKTKIDIISGFLGAGKTTFIKKMIKDLYTTDQVVILENEFGRINIDQETLGREGLTVKPIQAGCICCSSSMDLSKGIEEIIRDYHPERIIVEPTGIAKLSEIKKLFKLEETNQVCMIDHIITIVDAKNYYMRTMISKDFFEDQIRASEVIFLSKTEQMEEEKLYKVKEEISKIQPDCLIVDKLWEGMEPIRLREYINYKIDTSEVKHKLGMRKNHVNDFDRYEIISDDALNMNRITLFINEIKNGVFGEIHRIKGICKDSENGIYSVDYIPGEMIIKPVVGQHSEVFQSRICLIGRQINKEKLDEMFK